MRRSARIAITCLRRMMPLEHHPPYLISEAVVDRVVPCEHSINKRPIEARRQGLPDRDGLKLALIDPAL